jgi:hypothetical protein
MSRERRHEEKKKRDHGAGAAPVTHSQGDLRGSLGGCELGSIHPAQFGGLIHICHHGCQQVRLTAGGNGVGVNVNVGSLVGASVGVGSSVSVGGIDVLVGSISVGVWVGATSVAVAVAVGIGVLVGIGGCGRQYFRTTTRHRTIRIRITNNRKRGLFFITFASFSVWSGWDRCAPVE